MGEGGVERGRVTGKSTQEPLRGRMSPNGDKARWAFWRWKWGGILSGTVKMTKWSHERRPQQLALCRVIYMLFPN